MKVFAIAFMLLTIAGCEKTYTDPYGNTITKEEHERRVANDAAHDALINLLAECRANPAPNCPKLQN